MQLNKLRIWFGMGSNQQNEINNLFKEKKSPTSVFVFLIALYFISQIVVIFTSRSELMVNINGRMLPLSFATGIFTSIGNICIISMVAVYHRKGFAAALTILLVQFPSILMTIFVAGIYTSIPGLFTNLMTLVAIILIYSNDVKKEKYQKSLSVQAVTDRLTGIYNRFAATEYISSLISKKTPFAVVSIDINNFKSINDSLGHSNGNKILIEIAKRWKIVAESGASGTTDLVARLSGDEFCLIIKGYATKDDIIKTIKHYENVLENKFTLNDNDYFINASFGYAIYPDDAAETDTILSYSDVAMYDVKKKNSSNHICHFTQELLREENNLEIEREIRKAIDEDRIYALFQPQFDVNHHLRGFEALARMRDEEGNIVSPGTFIPVAEKVGLIDQIDSCVFDKSTRFFGEILKNHPADFTLSVNVSVRHLMKADFVDEIISTLGRNNFPADHLEIEITESIMIESAEKALECINELKNYGIKIAIDDFGTGYSSLSYLSKLPADLLKIDKSFIDKMNLNESSKQYVAAIISIGHIMNFEVISEGVEDVDQIETLKKINCDFIQGFIWGKPLPENEAKELLLNA